MKHVVEVGRTAGIEVDAVPTVPVRGEAARARVNRAADSGTARPAGPEQRVPEQGPALIGRDPETTLLRELLERGRTGDGGAMILVGDAGVGKSALLAFAERTAAAAGARVLTASGTEFEAAVSFSSLQQLLLPLMGDLTGVPPQHGAALRVALGFEEGPEQEFRQVCDAVLHLFQRASGETALLVMIDNLEWLDRSSATVLAEAVRQLAGGRLTFLGASRSQGRVPRLFGTGVRVVTVGPLDPASSGRLLVDAFPDMAATVRERMLVAARGNPLAILELPVALSAAQRRAAEPLPQRASRCERLQDMFESRARTLPTGTRRAMLLMALEPTADVCLLAAALRGGRPHDVLRPAVEAGLAFVAERTGQLHFKHPLVTAAVIALASAGERAEAHRALAGVLTARRGDGERRAWHLAEASSSPDEGVARLLEEAAFLVRRRGDALGAMAFLLRAADLSTGTEERLRRLSRAAIVGAGSDLGQAGRVIEDLQAADPDFSRSLSTAMAAATVIVNGEGDVDMAHRLLTRAIAAYPDATDARDDVLVEAVNALRWVCWLGGRSDLWAAYHEAVARLEPEPPRLLALYARSSVDPARTHADALLKIDEAIGELDSVDDLDHIIFVSDLAYLYDRIPSCRPALDRVVANFRAGGVVTPALWALLMIGLDGFKSGD